MRDRYLRGEIIPSNDWNEDLPFFGKYVWEDWKRDQATAQQTLDLDVLWQKVKPETILTPDEIHLCRPSEHKSSVTFSVYPTDEERLVLARQQLREEMRK